MLCLEHQSPQRRVLQREPDIGLSRLGELRAEIAPTPFGHAGQRSVKTLEAGPRQGIQQRLLVRKMAAR